MNDGDRNEPAPDVLWVLRSLRADPLPTDLDGERDETVILERLRLLADGDDGWIARNLEHGHWIGHVLDRINGGAVEHKMAANIEQGASADG